MWLNEKEMIFSYVKHYLSPFLHFYPCEKIVTFYCLTV
jgi:hypothetical protein